MITHPADEKELFVVRRHWFIFLAEAISMVFAAIFPLLCVLILPVFGYGQLLAGISSFVWYLLFIAYTVWIFVLWILLFIMWTNYYLDMLILTDKKVIRVEQNALFSREMSSFRLDRLQDITVEVNGLIATILNFGTIYIQTAGEMEEFVMHGVAHPYDVKNKIFLESQRQIEEWKIPPSVTPVGG